MRRNVIAAAAVVVFVLGAYLIFGPNGPGRQAAVSPPPTVAAAGVTAPIIAEGRVVPLQQALLRFERSGTISRIEVTSGAQVTAGQLLAALDNTAQQQLLAQAQAGQARAEAARTRLIDGAGAEALAVADAAVAQAEAGLAQVRSGVTTPDLAAAEAQLAEAEAARRELLAGADSETVRQTQAAFEQADANLAAQRTALSAAKTAAQLALSSAANLLRDRQADYSRISWENDDLQERIGDDALPQQRIDLEAAALRAVENAETALTQARVAADQAAQAEISGIAAAEARREEAAARRDALLQGADAQQIAAADARVSAAQAALNRLRGPTFTAQIAVAEAAVTQAEAARVQLAAPPTAAQLAVADADVAAAQAAVRVAEHELALTELRAPFAGTVGRIDLRVGEIAGPGGGVIALADLSRLQVETTDLSEIDAVSLTAGDAVTVTFDALPEIELAGNVVSLDPYGSERQGEIVYRALIDLAGDTSQLRWNMTAAMHAGR
jgi:HlyD family secretion protein